MLIQAIADAPPGAAFKAVLAGTIAVCNPPEKDRRTLPCREQIVASSGELRERGAANLAAWASAKSLALQGCGATPPKLYWD